MIIILQLKVNIKVMIRSERLSAHHMNLCLSSQYRQLSIKQ